MIDIAGCVGGHSDHPVEGENRNHKPDDKQGACVMTFLVQVSCMFIRHAPFYLSLTYYTPVDIEKNRMMKNMIQLTAAPKP